MKTKIEIKSIFGKVLFVYEKENATFKQAVESALRSGTNLRYANLSDANLSDADLRYADLSDADLSYANLRYANLIGANLSDADLRYANLSDADLSYANLRYANLIGADLSGSENKDKAYIPIFCKWSHCIIGDKIKIGCKEKTIEEWEKFFKSNEEFETKRGTDDFKQIKAVYNAYKAYLKTINK